jgi:hypothetical protein
MKRAGLAGPAAPLHAKRAGLAGLLAVLVVMGFIAPMHAQAEDDPAPVRITITGLAPVALGTGNSLAMGGTVANTGLATITSLSVRLTISTTPLTSRRDLDKATDAEGGFGSIPLYATTTAVVDTLPPGAKAAYRIATDTSQLPLGAPGIYVLGVEAIGFGPAGYVILDTSRMLIPYVPDAVDPVNVTWLWPLATTPAQTPDDVLLGDTISREVSPGGRLDDLLSAGGSSPSISWVVDPQVLQVADDMSDGYLVDKGGQIRAGTSADDAAAWLERARAILGPAKDPERSTPRQRPVWVMPYADPDADALTRAGLTTDLVRASTAAPEVAARQLERAPDGTLAWAAGGRLDQEALDVLASAGVRTVVVRDKSAPAAPGLDYTPSGYLDIEASGGRVRALIIDSGLLAALELPQGNQATILAARQRFLAELAFVALEPTEASRYLIAAAASPRWDPNPRLLRAIIASLRSTPWTRLVPVSTVLALPDAGTARIVETDARRARELDRDYLKRITETQASIESLRSVLTDPLPLTAPIASALLRAESSAWRTRPREGVRLLDSIDASITTAESSVYVVPRDDIVLSGDRGSVPVTVTNDFDQTVRVGVSITADPAARLDAEPLEVVEIEAGRRASLEVPVRVVGGDALTVAVQLTDPTGKPFGEPVALELRTTAYSRAALWVAVAAAAALILLVVYDIVRRARQRGARRREASA